ncbi:hypothetical protein C0Q70_19641 [Pomacea canaliculata]|uniref:5-oxoprolinase n=1 Tax=Pomacea canaliculata TaxID=400727 RepID=A0A2T7NJY7_POMCA|nr:5-oxoprolinase-like isoform X2 [Pomacea canaliculata]PVD21468.1 hypothetical protein C0Q70_19641 [Pomacea canaliculata]
MCEFEPENKGKGFLFAIDRGGTFTDVWAKCPSGKVRVLKLLSDDPSNYSDAPLEGIRRILQEETGVPYPPGEHLSTQNLGWIRMGTTVATNALLERKGERTALVITQGFQDLLQIGNQARPNIFDLAIRKPEELYEDVVEVEERLVMCREDCRLNGRHPVVIATTGEKLEVWQPVNETKLRSDLQNVYTKGIRCLAVVLMHAYIYPEHELTVSRIAKEIGFTQVSLSSHVMPMVRMVPRGYTACADAYLTPCIKKYVSSFSSGFKESLKGTHVLFMRSDGGLTPVHVFTGAQAILSGPAGGVVGYALTTYSELDGQPVIGFDMGGTSTDVSRYAGSYEHVFETTTAGVTIQAPQLDINTVAAGGGSILSFRAGLFVVGPESAGAHPGPACYRKGGPLTITDANLVLGRLLPEFFPCIFGENENEPLDYEASWKAFTALTDEVNAFVTTQETCNSKMSVGDVAMGFIQVANEAMCRPIRALTQAKGYDTAQHVLACFGGAGGQHACAIARTLGMRQVFIHRYASILSAYGMALADVVHEAQEPCALAYEAGNFRDIDAIADRLIGQCIQRLSQQGFSRDDIKTEVFLHMRYHGTDCALMVSANDLPATLASSRHGDFLARFLMRYRTEFGFTLQDRHIFVDDVRVRGVGKSTAPVNFPIDEAKEKPIEEKRVQVYFENAYIATPVYMLDKLRAGHTIEGPAIILDKNSTIVVEPNCDARITKHGDISITVGSSEMKIVGTNLDAVQLSIFSHRFMSIAEQMGRVLQRTSISTNIKERLDFSCALFGPDGGLVANAPHIPVHLGAMQETVQYQIRTLGNDILDGDVILSNHPQAGGSHLPDLTVITPVFYSGVSKPVFYVASRGHHADIGGITPGSMPPHSTSIHQEGAVFKSFKLVKEGVFQEEAVTEVFRAPGLIPGCSGSRNLQDNLSDLHAQVAANQKGITLVKELISEYSLPVIQAYMAYIQENAEVAVREMLKEIAQKTKACTGTTTLSAHDFLDDGSLIALQVHIDELQGTAVFDFANTGFEVYGNCNAPRAVVLSALIYCLRSMVGHDIPLNQGCLKPVNVLIPKGSLLDPSEQAAVVGGNVLTSQRIVDVILRAFGSCAASQGCMNNITFGDENMGYYETVAGGAGAGPSWHGCSGVHTHMTNTRITDPEIIERRYPVILKCFHLNRGSGGKGVFHGGDGVIREILFRKPLTLSVLTERRVFSPYGLQGGKNGRKGRNLMFYKDGRIVSIGAKMSVAVSPGDIFHLETPGGGGYGDASSKQASQHQVGEEANFDMLDSFPKFPERGSVHQYRLSQESA